MGVDLDVLHDVLYVVENMITFKSTSYMEQNGDIDLPCTPIMIMQHSCKVIL